MAISIRKIIRCGSTEELDAMNIDTLYNMFKDILFQKVITIFKWNNLPFPQRELEMRMCSEGYCGVVKDSKVGIMCASGSMSGATQYTDVFKNFTYAAATAEGGTFEIGKKCVIAVNNSVFFSFVPLIEMYASLLTHARISLKTAMVNTRYQDIIVTSDTNTTENVKKWYKDLYKGEMSAILDETLARNANIENVANTGKNIDLKSYCDLESEILRAFFREIGVRWVRDKRSNMLEAEIVEDGQLLMININDMYNHRIQFCEDYNRVFKDQEPISVEYSEPFKRIIEEGVLLNEDDRLHGDTEEETEVPE